MFKSLLSFFVLLIFSQVLNAQENRAWQWSHPKPQGNSLRWIKMWDNNNWYAVGYGGTFMKTTNAGVDWFINHRAGKMMADGSSDLLYSAYFRNMDSGFTIGVGGVYTTVDGGNTFQPLEFPLAATASFYQATMINDMVGYIAGTTSGKVAKTSDGGYRWNSYTSLPSATYYDVATYNDTTLLFFYGAGNIQRSTDGGLTFTQLSIGVSATMYKAQFKDANTVYCAGSSGNVRMSTDAGLTWTAINTGLPSSYFYDLDIVGDAIYVTGDSYNIYKTTDNGTTWTPINFLAPLAQQPITSSYYSTDFLADRFVTVGGYGLINLKIGENTATAFTTLKKVSSQYAVWNNTQGKVISVGSASSSGMTDQVLVSTDAGLTWVNATFTSPGSTSTFRSIEMANDSVGFIVGTSGAIWKTIDGGFNWNQLTTPSAIGTSNLFDVDFVNDSTGWIFGQAAHVWKTTDAGLNWTQQVSNTSSSYAIFSGSMLDANTGWLSGGNGILSFTSDGGTTWLPKTSNTSQILYSIKVINQNVAYFAGQSTISKTTDGGATWNIISLPPTWTSSNKIYAMDFADELNGVVAGQGATAVGTVAYTTDGGVTWVPDFTGSSTIQGVSIVKDGPSISIFAAGNNSNIVKYTNAVIPVELSSFTAVQNGSNVVLTWTTATELNTLGFEVEKSSNRTEFNKIGFVKGSGSSTDIKQYSFTDMNEAGTVVYYRLKMIDLDGSFEYSPTVQFSGVNVNSFTLEQNYPNPFNPSTIISYNIPVDGLVKLTVYNSLGEEVAILVNANLNAGSYNVEFNGENFTSGIYFYKLQVGEFTSVKKMMMMK